MIPFERTRIEHTNDYVKTIDSFRLMRIILYVLPLHMDSRMSVSASFPILFLDGKRRRRINPKFSMRFLVILWPSEESPSIDLIDFP